MEYVIYLDSITGQRLYDTGHAFQQLPFAKRYSTRKEAEKRFSIWSPNNKDMGIEAI